MTTSREYYLRKDENLGIYIHVPFCKSKCYYCSFYSKSGLDFKQEKNYVNSIEEDIYLYGQDLGKDGENRKVDTIFFGGGTPSILDSSSIETILETLDDSFYIDEKAEITIEANPATFDYRKVKRWKDTGINRLSLGVQSLDNSVLKAIGRIHSREEAIRSYITAREAGFDNINIDLMFSLPNQDIKILERTLDEISLLEPDHLSYYSLQIEEDTKFYSWLKSGKIEETPDDMDRKMYHYGVDFLESKGYSLYEISNLSLKDKECRHNLKYWNFSDYLGLGFGSSSFVDGCRWTEGEEPIFVENTFFDCVSEYAFTALRRREGIRYEEFFSLFNRNFWQVFAKERQEVEYYIENNFLVEDEKGLYLTREGIDISNSIMAIFV